MGADHPAGSAPVVGSNACSCPSAIRSQTFSPFYGTARGATRSPIVILSTGHGPRLGVSGGWLVAFVIRQVVFRPELVLRSSTARAQ